MSVRHQVRAYVERLFEGLKEGIKGGELNLYCVYSPVYVQRENLPANQIEVEEFEFVDMKVNLEDPESVKKTLDRITRETLEREVKGFYLLGLACEGEDAYIFSSENPILEELKGELIERLERLKEE
ncbi:MAG: hypothetical protein RMH93_06295 [Aquificaceae bacterium]|nr:hypothetical protein [Aquificaceae bacterium]